MADITIMGSIVPGAVSVRGDTVRGVSAVENLLRPKGGVRFGVPAGHITVTLEEAQAFAEEVTGEAGFTVDRRDRTLPPIPATEVKVEPVGPYDAFSNFPPYRAGAGILDQPAFTTEPAPGTTEALGEIARRLAVSEERKRLLTRQLETAKMALENSRHEAALQIMVAMMDVIVKEAL